MADRMMSIGKISKRTGLALSAIRYYETMGLVRPIRSSSGQRQFRQSDIRRLSFVQIAQQFGCTIAQIREELERLPDNRTPTKSDWARISQKFRSDLDTKIATLTRLRENLEGCIGCGCLSLKACKLYNPGDIAAATGPGPRYIQADRPKNIQDQFNPRPATD